MSKGIITSTEFVIGFKSKSQDWRPTYVIKQYTLLTYNTRNFFKNKLCLCLKKGNRILYVPSITNAEVKRTTTTYDSTATQFKTTTEDYIAIDFSKAFGYKKNNVIYYFLTDIGVTNKYIASIFIQGEWSLDGNGFIVGNLYVEAEGNCLGLDYKFTLKNIGKIPFLPDLTILAGEKATFKFKLYTRNALVNYEDKFEITCECSDDTHTTGNYNVYANTIYFNEGYKFSLKET